MNNRIIAVCGPTASGKTALAVEISKKYNGEVISFDSMQIYRKMNIGTAKPTKEEMQGIPHHLIDTLDITENFSTADFSLMFSHCAKDILSRGKLPVACGGTGLNIDSVMFNTSFSPVPTDEELRSKLLSLDADELWQKLFEADAQSAEKIHKNNKIRVERAYEIYLLTGKTKTYWDSLSRKKESDFDFKLIVLDFEDREKLYERINKRVDLMLEAGLIDEIKGLLDSGELVPGTTAYQAIGYKEIIPYVSGEISLDEAVATLKQATRNYAKRQLTWFRRYGNAMRIFVDRFDCNTNIIMNEISDIFI